MTLGGSESPNPADAAVPTFLSERVKQRKLGAFGFSPGDPLLSDAVFSSLLSAEVKVIIWGLNDRKCWTSVQHKHGKFASQVWISQVVI